ncbi:MAG: hypothetical protein GF364_02995 [Candidatus Lokiarchaeota archaeon]|nr:hypothetical protein [Candidatus Lokiarchaeota archaeon]
MNSKNPIIIFDNGSFQIRAGFSYENKPRIITETLVGIPKYRDYGTALDVQKESVFGGEVYSTEIGVNFYKKIYPESIKWLTRSEFESEGAKLIHKKIFELP